MDDHERQLEETVDDLAETLETLRAEIQEPPRGPLGVPRPPTPGEFLRLTEQYTIPALVTTLETGIRTLELLAAAIRIADGRPLDGDATGRRGAAPARTDHIASASRRTLQTLDDALAELQSAAVGGEPDNPELQRLLSEARELRDDVDDRLGDATSLGRADLQEPDPIDIEVKNGEDESEPSASEGGGDEDDVGVDVDQELDSIKREFDETPDDVDGENADGGGPGDRDGGSGDDRDDDGAGGGPGTPNGG